MHSPHAVIVAGSAHAVAIRKRFGGEPTVAVYSEAETLRLLPRILAHPPKILALEATFAGTARGAALVASVMKAAESTVELRVLIDDAGNLPLILSHSIGSAEHAILDTSRPLEQAGTRRAVRYPMHRRRIVVNGELSKLVDLSVTGAQILVPMRLRPGQNVRIAIPDDAGDIRCQGTTAWATVAPTGTDIEYRAGVEFLEPPQARLAEYCVKVDRGRDHDSGLA